MDPKKHIPILNPVLFSEKGLFISQHDRCVKVNTKIIISVQSDVAITRRFLWFMVFGEKIYGLWFFGEKAYGLWFPRPPKTPLI